MTRTSTSLMSEEEIERKLARALAVGGNTHTPHDIWVALENESMQLWMNGDSFVITEVIHYPQVSTLDVAYAVGKLEDVLVMHPAVAEFARGHGCTKMRMQGRKGWQRVLPAYGWKANPRVFFELEL
jgi:hypothetical protein